MLLKRMDIESGQFEANGKKYFVESSMSIDRYRKFEEIEVELGYGRSFAEIFDQVKQAYDTLNQNNMRPMDAGVILYNILTGAAQFKQKMPHIFRYCALFINEENEDRTTISEDLIRRKVNDWQAEGFDYQDFFTLGINSLNGYKDRYKLLTQVFSIKQEQ